MIVCVCRRVSDHEIRRAASEGAVTLDCLRVELGVAMQCGRCADCAERVLGEACRETRVVGTSSTAVAHAA